MAQKSFRIYYKFAEFVRGGPLDADFRVLAFMMAAAVVSGLIFGIAPAIQATRGSIVQAARGDFGHMFRPQRLRNALVLVQITVCSMLLIYAGLLLRGANGVATLDTGMRTHDVISVEMQEKSRDRVLARLATEPLVTRVAASTTLPLDSGFPSGRVVVSRGKLTDSSYDYVSPEFFDVLGIAIDRGRNFTDEEARSAAPVAIVSRAFARRVWPGAEAIGQPLVLLPDARSHLSKRTPLREQQFQVIGVSRDVNTSFTEDENSRMLVYFPIHSRAAGTVLLLRANGGVEAAPAEYRQGARGLGARRGGRNSQDAVSGGRAGVSVPDGLLGFGSPGRVGPLADDFRNLWRALLSRGATAA
jgi:hypothetical protein